MRPLLHHRLALFQIAQRIQSRAATGVHGDDKRQSHAEHQADHQSQDEPEVEELLEAAAELLVRALIAARRLRQGVHQRRFLVRKRRGGEGCGGAALVAGPKGPYDDGRPSLSMLLHTVVGALLLY